MTLIFPILRKASTQIWPILGGGTYFLMVKNPKSADPVVFSKLIFLYLFFIFSIISGIKKIV